ncbi:MAG: hypothetical protein L0Y80_01805 [Ignavibacteriae bacterium]|nr:hypothetical protein [Ignavibacteriota bacterium]
MIRFFFVLFLTLLALKPSMGQLLCVAGKEFKYPEIARRAGVTASFQVVLNVNNFSPLITQITGVDSSSNQYLNLFKQSLIDNLNQLTYLNDTANFQMKVTYSIRHFRTLNNSYVEIIDPDEIHFVAQSPRIEIIVDYMPFPSDPNIDSVVVETTVPFKSGKAIPSDILVQRLFDDEAGSTVILRNNYPDLREEIIAVASRYSKDYFLGIGSNAHYYFIKLKVERKIPECGLEQIY